MFCKPRFIGQCILALSKIVMYEFHYDIMHKYFGYHNVKLGMSDTDSFLYLIQHKGDIYKKLKEINIQHNIFDFSNYPKDHVYFNMNNALTPGCFKDEGGGGIYTEDVFTQK